MIYLCNSEGVIVASVPSAVNQGSVGVNEIVLIAPFPASCAVSLALTLPNGVLVYPQAFPPASEDYPYVMTLSESFKNLLEGGYNVWTMKLDKALTQVAGTARISFFITGSAGETISTPSTQFNINKSAGYILNATPEDVGALNSYIEAAIQARDDAQTFSGNAEAFADDARIAASEAERIQTEVEQTATDAESNLNDIIAEFRETLGVVFFYRGSVQNFSDLPTNPKVGDVYNVESAYGNYPAGTNFAWNGTAWDPLSGAVNLTAYLTKAEAEKKYLTLPTEQGQYRLFPYIDYRGDNEIGEVKYLIFTQGYGADTVVVRDGVGNAQFRYRTLPDHALTMNNFGYTPDNSGIGESVIIDYNKSFTINLNDNLLGTYKFVGTRFNIDYIGGDGVWRSISDNPPISFAELNILRNFSGNIIMSAICYSENGGITPEVENVRDVQAIKIINGPYGQSTQIILSYINARPQKILPIELSQPTS